MIKFDVTTDLDGLKKYEAGLLDNSPHMRRLYKQWGVRYRSFTQERFDKFSKGGGNWKPLAASTLAARRGGSASILRDTNTLFQALSPVFMNAPGQMQKFTPKGITIGIGGAQSHPGGNATIADIAKYHHFGMGHNPKREIFVKPPSQLLNKMADDARRALARLSNVTS